MRAALWFLALFAMAVGLALVTGNNQAVISLFWPPYRLDMSLNLFLILLIIGGVATYLAIYAYNAVRAIPAQAHRWRVQQKERSMHASLLDALSHLMAGRYIRGRKSAQAAIAHENSLAALTGESVPYAAQLRALSHVLAAQGAQALQDQAGRDEHLRQALRQVNASAAQTQETREGLQLRAVQWAMDDRNASAAWERLSELPQGVARRAIALRLKLKAARQLGRTQEALETTRALARHRAFTPQAAQSIVRSLGADLIRSAHEPSQLQRIWNTLDTTERALPELAVLAAQRLLMLEGDPALARQWLLPVWEKYIAPPKTALTNKITQSKNSTTLSDRQRTQLIQSIESAMPQAESAEADRDWLQRIEAAQQNIPNDAGLQYLYGIACQKHQLWGKAQQLLTQATQNLKHSPLTHKAWLALAHLAEQRHDAEAAARAWKNAALTGDEAARSWK